MSCYICGIAEDTESHHIILRSECKPLESCQLNIIRVCNRCHDFIHHDSRGYKKLKELKLEYQNKLEFLFDKEYLTREEIKEVLQIKDKPLDRLLKTLIPKKSLYKRSEVILRCMAGKMIIGK